MSFVHHTMVRFAHVDAAGIVFYPRYFEMLNAAVEEWFGQRLGRGFRELHLDDRIGTPTVSLQCEFVAPASLGDRLDVTIEPLNVGGRSCTIAFRIGTNGKPCLHGSVVLVCMDLDHKRSRPWPEAVKAAMNAALPSDRDDRVA